jgi:hypothetical protein
MVIADETAPVITETATTEVKTPVTTETATTEVKTPVTTEIATTEVKTPATTETATTEVKKEDAQADTTELSPQAKAGIIAAITTFLANRRENVYYGLDTVAGYTFNPILTRLASCDCLKGGRFEANIKPMNRVLVSAAAVAVVFAAYKAYVAQQEASEDFDADFDVDNN